MSKILLIAAAVFLLGTAGLSFLNKGKMTAKTDELKRISSVIAAAQGEAAKARSTLKENDRKLGEQSTRAVELQNQLTAAQSDLAKLKDETSASTKNLADKDAEIERLNKAVAAAASGQKIAPEGNDVVTQLQTLTTQRDELKTVNDSLQNRVKGMETQVAELQRRENSRQAGIARPGLAGRVLAVDRNWNFVVLSLGDRNGVNSNTTMVVRRGDSLVGRVRITSVEPSQSIADIVPNSVPPGVSVEAGDTVIFPGGS